MKNVKPILAELHKELRRAEDVDIESREAWRDLYADIAKLEERNSPDIQWVLDRVRTMESDFAAGHPLLERMARELADAIAKMGI